MSTDADRTDHTGSTDGTEQLRLPDPAGPDSAASGGTIPSETASAGTSPAAPERPQPRTGPTAWGCLLLAFCAHLVQRVFAPGTVDTAVWITGTIFGLGALLLGVGIAILARNARRRR